MKELIMELAACVAPAGREDVLHAVLTQHLANCADDIQTDVLGNLIARKHGQGQHVALVAHADEAGVMAMHADDEGFVRLTAIGDVRPACLPGQTVQFCNGVMAVIGAEARSKTTEVGWAQLFADIGACSQAEALARLPIGTAGVVWAPVQPLSEHRLGGRAVAQRTACAVVIEAFRALANAGRQVSAVFTAQQTVGARGARTAAYNLQPELTLVVGAAPAGDTPEGPRMALRLGAGPALKVMDGTLLTPARVLRHLADCAERCAVPVQYEVWPGGQTDAGVFQWTTGGRWVGGVSCPARMVSGSVSVVDVRDAAAAVRVLTEAVGSYA
ncbi:MAG: peptidase M42 [Alicyclobacillus sp.]|nr:peptidase M42 [Alicyclobacillus sp.]